MYPLKFQNLYFEKIWGGRDFEKFRNNLPKGNIGESWDIACHPNGIGIVANGDLKGMSFEQLIKTKGKEILGKSYNGEKFPLLVKLINSKDKLSVQVHPNDEYATKFENSYGKTESWYVVDAKPGASLIVGTKNCTKETFKKAIDEGNIEKYLNKIEVKKGDCFLINSGLVHAICEGVIIAEIQQNSDITYRIYDYNRGREIHVEKSLDVIDFNLQAINESNNKLNDFKGYSKGMLCNCEFFKIEKYIVNTEFTEESNEDKFYIFTCVEGNGKISWNNGTESLDIFMGDSILIPSSLGEYTIKGDITLLKSFQ